MPAGAGTKSMLDMRWLVGAFIKTMQEYPPMQKGGSFNLDSVKAKAKTPKE
jgi:hypothetical protein